MYNPENIRMEELGEGRCVPEELFWVRHRGCTHGLTIAWVLTQDMPKTGSVSISSWRGEELTRLHYSLRLIDTLFSDVATNKSPMLQ